MKKKYMKVRSCTECFYLQGDRCCHVGTFETREDGHMYARQVNFDNFPVWCPLPDLFSWKSVAICVGVLVLVTVCALMLR